MDCREELQEKSHFQENLERELYSNSNSNSVANRQPFPLQYTMELDDTKRKDTRTIHSETLDTGVMEPVRQGSHNARTGSSTDTLSADTLSTDTLPTDTLSKEDKHRPVPHECEPCMADNQRCPSVFYCPVCVEFYCQTCGQRHSLFKLTSSHTLIPLTEEGTPFHVYEEIPDATFDVVVIETTVSARCRLNGRFTLLLKTTELCILHPITWALLYSWPYNVIRGFGVTPAKNEFLFESGRRSDTGHGYFRFRTTEWKSIYETVLSRVNATSIQRDDDVTNDGTHDDVTQEEQPESSF